MKVLITGWPRSGTMYVAEALARCGLRVTHEKVFMTGAHVVNPNQCDVEVSWLAVGHDPAIIQTNVPIIRLIRDPLKVLASNVANAPFAIPHPVNTAKFASAKSFGDAQLCCCIAFMVEWWHRMKALPIAYVMNVERFAYQCVEKIARLVPMSGGAYSKLDLTAWEAVPTDFNHLNPTLALSADDSRLRPMGPLLEEWEKVKGEEIVDTGREDGRHHVAPEHRMCL